MTECRNDDQRNRRATQSVQQVHIPVVVAPCTIQSMDNNECVVSVHSQRVPFLRIGKVRERTNLLLTSSQVLLFGFFPSIQVPLSSADKIYEACVARGI